MLLLGVEGIDALMRVFGALRGALQLTAFEFFTDRALHHVRAGQGLPAPPYKNDLSVTVATVPEFLRRMGELLDAICPDLEVVWYGHIGDGNLHMNILKPASMDLQEFEGRSHDISGRTYALTRELGGSISAEHGIGLLKRPWLDQVRSSAEIEFMRGIKRVFDPAGIFNPGKLLPAR